MVLYDSKGRIKLQKKDKKKHKKGKIPAEFTFAFSESGSPVIVPSNRFITSVDDIYSDGDWIDEAERCIRKNAIRWNIDINGDSSISFIKMLSHIANGSKPIGSSGLGKSNLDRLNSIAEYVCQLCMSGSYDGVDISDDSIQTIFEVLNLACKPDTPYALDILSKFVAAAKSFYEYSDKLLVNDVVYDESIEVLKKNEYYEPTTIAPIQAKGRIKVSDDELSDLAINMNKSYAVYNGDKIPDGAASTTTIEEWLERAIRKTLCNDDIYDISVGVKIDRKFDGVAVRAIVDNGVIHKPLTRGDYDGTSTLISGLEGYVLSKNIHGRFGCQFEAVVTDKVFNIKSNPKVLDIVNHYGLKTEYASNRSMAAAIINRMSIIDGYSDLSDLITLIPVAVVPMNNNNIGVGLLDEIRAEITPDIIPLTIVGTLSECLSRIDSIIDSCRKNRTPEGLPTDGVVLSLNAKNIRDALGRTNRTNNWQIAYKFEPEAAIGVVSSVSITSGRKGGKGILIHLKEAIELGGNQYTKIPAGSKAVFENLNLAVGDEVLVSYINDVMPQIASVQYRGDGEKLELPEVCNCCGQPLSIRNKRPFCENIHCKDNVAGRISAFIDAFCSSNIENSSKLSNVGVDGVASFIEAVISETLPIVNMTATMKENVSNLRNELIYNLPKKKNYEILSYVGIPGIGSARAKELIDKFGSYRNLIKAVESFDIETTDITGKTILNCMIELNRYLDDVKAMMGFIGYDYLAGYTLTATPLGCAINIAKSVEQTVVGHSEYSIKKDEKILSICEEHDFEITDGKKFDILIVKSLDSDSLKAEKARKKNIPMFTPKQFIKFYSGN